MERSPSDEQEFRAQAAKALALTSVVAAGPFGVADLVTLEHPASGAGTLALVAALAGHAALAARAPHLARFSGPALVPLCLAAILLSLREHGVGALFWCYPAVLGYCCLLEERTAWAACALTLAAVLALSSAVLPPEVVLRAGATLAVVATFAATVVRVITVQNRRLQSRVETDSLTGLPNRRSLDAGLARAVADAAAGVPMTLLALDIDRFKRVNDDHGHAAGDAVLRATGAFLRGRTRAGDTAWRTGGEEFLVLLHGADAENAAALAEALLREYPARVSRPDGPATFSVGLASLGAAERVDDWLRRADRALYRAKAEGRNRLAVAAPAPAQPSSAADSSGSASKRSATSP